MSLVDQIIAKGQPASIRKCVALTKRGLMRFDGNQWNESWAWERLALEKLNEGELLELLDDSKSDANLVEAILCALPAKNQQDLLWQAFCGDRETLDKEDVWNFFNWLGKYQMKIRQIVWREYDAGRLLWDAPFENMRLP